MPVGLDKIARIGFNYKLNPFELDLNQFITLHFCLPKMHAEEEIHHRNIASYLSPERIFYLTFMQTRDIDKALIAKSERWLETSRAEAMKDLKTLG